MREMWYALRYASTMPVRIMLMASSFLWAVFFLITPEVILSYPTYRTLLHAGGKYLWAAMFFLNGTLLLWRITDKNTRIGWQRFINALTCALWGAYIGVSITAVGAPKPDLADDIVMVLSATWLTLRTDLTPNDRATA